MLRAANLMEVRAMHIIKVAAIVVGLALVGCSSEGGGSARIGDEPEQVTLPQIKVNLPPSPSFQKEHAPESYPDSAYSVYGVRRQIATTLNKEVRVKGYITEVYECPPCPTKNCPKQCDKPHFYLSDRANGPKEEALMVVDYPKEDAKKKKTTFDVGVQHYVSGTFSKTSGTGFSNSDGLLIFKEAKKVGAE
jgi:hypothetical protein